MKFKYLKNKKSKNNLKNLNRSINKHNIKLISN